MVILRLSIYTYLKNTNNGFYENIFKNVGKFICENFSNEKIQKFIYHSTFYKCIAIEYAYSIGQNELAKQTIKEIENALNDDIRKNDEHIVPDFAK